MICYLLLFYHAVFSTTSNVFFPHQFSSKWETEMLFLLNLHSTYKYAEWFKKWKICVHGGRSIKVSPHFKIFISLWSRQLQVSAKVLPQDNICHPHFHYCYFNNRDYYHCMLQWVEYKYENFHNWNFFKNALV